MDHRLFFLLVPSLEDKPSKDDLNRLKAAAKWGIEGQVRFDDPSWLQQYVDHLMNERGLSPNSTRSHLSTTRSRIRKLIKNGSLRRHLAQSGLSEEQIDALIGRLLEAISPSAIKVHVPRMPSHNLNLDHHHIQMLLEGPDASEPIGLRNLAVISLIVATGIGQHEVAALNVEDLQQELDGQTALHVPSGRGCTERLIPYGENIWVLSVVRAWLRYAGIKEGAVFRSLYKSGRKLRNNRLSRRAVERLVANYPILVGGETVALKPLDLRHAYARHQFRRGVGVETIREWLGFNTIKPVMDYLGNARFGDKPAQPYHFDFSRLERWENDGRT